MSHPTQPLAVRQLERLKRLRDRRRRVRDLATECANYGATAWRLERLHKEARRFCEALGRAFVPVDEDRVT